MKLAAGLALGPKQKDHSISHQKVEILVTSEWPNGWGLYVQMPKTPTIHAKGLEVELRRHPETGEVLAIRVYIAGVSAYLLLGVPDVPSSFGMHRPRGLIFRNLPGEKRIEFEWPDKREEAVIYGKVSAIKSEPPHWKEWKS